MKKFEKMGKKMNEFAVLLLVHLGIVENILPLDRNDIPRSKGIFHDAWKLLLQSYL